jgi:nitrite reductase/ring-hydroxylating ferredoxin subunit
VLSALSPLSLRQALDNRITFTPRTNCSGGYDPTSTPGIGRKLKIVFNDIVGVHSLGIVDMSSVPWALHSRRVGGFEATSLLRVNDAGVLGSVDALTTPNFTELKHLTIGQIIEPMDGLAYIGHNPGDKENVYIVSGDSGHGLTHGTIAGMLLTDLISDRHNPWVKLYDPHRFSWKVLGSYLSENLNSAMQYRDWFISGDVDSFREI